MFGGNGGSSKKPLKKVKNPRVVSMGGGFDGKHMCFFNVQYIEMDDLHKIDQDNNQEESKKEEEEIL